MQAWCPGTLQLPKHVVGRTEGVSMGWSAGQAGLPQARYTSGAGWRKKGSEHGEDGRRQGWRGRGEMEGWMEGERDRGMQGRRVGWRGCRVG
jgi:hypothetical protein